MRLRDMVELSCDEQALLDGPAGTAMALRILVEAARLLGAPRLIPIHSAHIDGCLYHGDGGMLYAERLVELGARVAVSTTLNVGALDLRHPEHVWASSTYRAHAKRQMDAYLELGCRPSWTCAPYQAGHRPERATDVAWGESNAVAFANSVLGARTNRYGDLLDIAAAITGRVPYCGLHVPENRRATMVVDVSTVPEQVRRLDAFYPVLGAWLGARVGDQIPVLVGVPEDVREDQLKTLGAGAASTGSVGLFHVAGVTPEAPDLETATGGRPPARAVRMTLEDVHRTRDSLGTASGEEIDYVAVGSPHFSVDESLALLEASAGVHFRVPFYVCTRRDALDQLTRGGQAEILRNRGVVFVVDTCVVVTPILRGGGVMMTNSAKFAHYAPATAGLDSVFGTLEDCVASAAAGRVRRDSAVWR